MSLARVKEWLGCPCHGSFCSRKYWVSRNPSDSEVVAVQPVSNQKLAEVDKVIRNSPEQEPEDVPPPLPTSPPPKIDPLAPVIIFLEPEISTVTVIIPPSK